MNVNGFIEEPKTQEMSIEPMLIMITKQLIFTNYSIIFLHEIILMNSNSVFF